MIKNTIDVEWNKIVLRLGNPLDWTLAQRITGKVDDLGGGCFSMALSTQNMHRILEYFPGEARPTVVSGRKFLDKLQIKLAAYKQARARIQEVMSRERWPVESNGKFIPYAHQTKIIGGYDANPFTPVFAGCGLGKTGSSGRSMEEVLRRGEVRPGHILVSAPLSILHTSWADDLTKFTHLRHSILWTPLSNRVFLDDRRSDLGLAGKYEEKPAATITTKRKTGSRWWNKATGAVKKELDALDGDPKYWTKCEVTWKVAVLLDGSEEAFGRLTGREMTVEATRENFIREQLSRKDVDVFLINHDGVRIYEEILKEYQMDWVLVDESTKIKNPSSAVSHSHDEISWKCVRRSALTGTPNPNGFIDLWHQFYFLDRGLTLEPTLKDYLHEYFKPEVVGKHKTAGGNKLAIKYVIRNQQAREELIARVRSVSIVLEQRECIDLPPRQDLKRISYMTPEQETAYDSMSVQLVAELKDSVSGRTVRADAVNSLAKIMKLRQITSGFLMNREGEKVAISNNPKLSDLDDFLEELQGQKVVIGCQFREELNLLLARYKDYGVQPICGGLNPEVKAQSIRDFQETDKCNMLLVQPKAGGHGLTFTAASNFVYLSLDYNFELYHQVAKRVERIGQVNPIFVIHCLMRYSDGEPTVDEDLFDVLQQKAQDHDAFFSKKDESEIAEILTQKFIQRVEKRNGIR